MRIQTIGAHDYTCVHAYVHVYIDTNTYTHSHVYMHAISLAMKPLSGVDLIFVRPKDCLTLFNI